MTEKKIQMVKKTGRSQGKRPNEKIKVYLREKKEQQRLKNLNQRVILRRPNIKRKNNSASSPNRKTCQANFLYENLWKLSPQLFSGRNCTGKY